MDQEFFKKMIAKCARPPELFAGSTIKAMNVRVDTHGNLTGNLRASDADGDFRFRVVHCENNAN